MHGRCVPDGVAGRGRRGRRGRFALVVSSALLAGAACAGTNRADPGDRRLHAIRADPGFRLVLPGTRLADEHHLPAKKVTFTDSYFGPSATRTLTVVGNANDVLTAYEQAIEAIGWRPAGTTPFMSYGSHTYRRTFGSWDATLTLTMYPDEQHKLVVEISAPAEGG